MKLNPVLIFLSAGLALVVKQLKFFIPMRRCPSEQHSCSTLRAKRLRPRERLLASLLNISHSILKAPKEHDFSPNPFGGHKDSLKETRKFKQIHRNTSVMGLGHPAWPGWVPIFRVLSPTHTVGVAA